MAEKKAIKAKIQSKKVTKAPLAKAERSKAKAPAYTSKAAWKKAGARQWPPPDDPLQRHSETEADLALSAAPSADSMTPGRLRLAALQFAQTMASPAPETPGGGTVPPTSGGSNWTQLGPLAIPNGQTYGGARVLVTGRVTAIAIDPSAPDTIYLGSAQGGVWKTNDGGLSWDPKSDNEVSLAIGALTLDPNFPNIVYVGTGEGNFSGDSYYGLGILKSVDGGNTWTNLASTTFPGVRFCRLVVTPSTGSPATQLFAATTAGLFRSQNGGSSWTILTSGLPAGEATDVVMDPLNPSTIYVAFWGQGIYSCTNANAAAPTFIQLTSGLPLAAATPPNGFTRVSLGISLTSPQTVYALMANNKDYTVDKFYVTTNGGSSWSAIALPSGSIGGQGFYNLAVNVDLTTPDIVYLSGISLWKAVKSGTVWTITDIGGLFHPDNHALAFRPANHLALYAASDGGIYKSSDGGTTWDDSINKGLGITQFEFIDQHPTSTAVVFGGTQDNGTEQYRGTPVFNHADDGDGGFVVVNQNDPTNVVSTYYNPSPKLSTQGGKFGTWTNVSTGIVGTAALFYPPMTACRTNPSLLAIGTNVVNLDPTQGTGGWPKKVTLPGLGTGERISALCYVDPNLIYAATELSKVYKLVQVGGVWTATLISQAPLPASSYIWEVSPLPGSPNTIVVVLSGFNPIGHVWKGAVPTVGLATWTNISGTGIGILPNIPVNAQAIDPLNANRIFIGTDIGVFETVDGGTTWALISGVSAFSTGLPNCAVFDLRLHESTRILRAATHGRGLWEKPVDAPSTPVVDLYVRDHVMDTARVLPTPNNVGASFEDPLRFVTLGDSQWWWMCADIKVDALEGAIPAYQMPVSAVDYVAFEWKLQHRHPQRTRTNRVYVQLNNRGFQPAVGVNVKILYADASAGLPNLPADFWTAFPSGSTNTTQWHPVGSAQTIASLKPGIPVVLEWDWTPPATAAEHSCMLVVLDCVSDPIPASNKVFDLGTLVPTEKRVGLKNLHVLDPQPAAPPPSTILGFNATSKRAQTIQIVPQGKGAPKVSLVFSVRAIPPTVQLRGLTAGAPTKTLLQALTKKYGNNIISAFDTTKIFSLSGAGAGELTAVLGQSAVRAIVVVEGSAQGLGGAVFSVIQREGGRVIGGSTFVQKRVVL
jgi:photosystem II stability/assembly factor-like uncharacterized protein